MLHELLIIVDMAGEHRHLQSTRAERGVSEELLADDGSSYITFDNLKMLPYMAARHNPP